MKIGVTGANSAVGKHLLKQYGGGDEFDFVAGVRSEKAAQSIPKVPGVTPAVVRFNDSEGLAEAFEGCSAIIHLAGILFETRESTYEIANVQATRAVVETAERLGNVQLIFVSALGADAKSSNGYLRSKGVCEELISNAAIPSTIIRTPLLLGPGTAGGQTLLRDARRRETWLLGGGKHRLRPLDVDDLCRAMLGVCRQLPEGKFVYELVGPESLRYRELVELTARSLGGQVRIRAVPIGLAKLAASAARMVTGAGMSRDIIEVITTSEDVDRNGNGELATELTALRVTIEKIVREKS